MLNAFSWSLKRSAMFVVNYQSSMSVNILVSLISGLNSITEISGSIKSSIFFNYSSFKITLPLVIYPYVLGPLFVFAFSIKTVTSYTTFSKYVDSLSILD